MVIVVNEIYIVYKTYILYYKSCICTCLHGLPTSHVVRVVEVRHPGLGSVAHAHI